MSVRIERIKVFLDIPDKAVQDMFDSHKEGHVYKVVTSYEDADLVCFCGGSSDVMPFFYGQMPIVGCSYEPRRDTHDRALYMKAVNDCKSMVGIGRGAQFLCVMNGGSLWQDVTGHREAHDIWDVTDTEGHKMFMVPSDHHQMMRIPSNGIIVAYSSECLRFVDQHKILKDTESRGINEVEVAVFQETGCLCYQPHPEIDGFSECREHFFDLIIAMMSLDTNLFGDGAVKGDD